MQFNTVYAILFICGFALGAVFQYIFEKVYDYFNRK